VNQQANTGVAESAAYDPAVALEFFKAAGKPAAVKQGEKIFEQNEREIPLIKRSKVYLLLQGEVALSANGRAIGSVRPGEIFGEMAVITHAPRSASAQAKADSSVIALDDKAFQAGLAKKPQFALMMMSVMIHRLRETIAQLRDKNAISEDAQLTESAAFDATGLTQLVQGLGDDTPIFYREGQSILAEGQKGLRMYAVVEGNVKVSIGGKVVERLGPGGVFGEAALIHASSTRIADAVAESDCSLLPIDRKAFLSLVKLSPDFAQALLSSLAGRLRSLTAKLR
jgi:CRP/FNR family transcriptional regulator, cyclic AMP receptor protein